MIDPRDTVPTVFPCGTNACVELTVEGDKIAATSTLGADRGKVLYDPAEMVGFIEQVKDGQWDGIYEQAKAMSASELTIA